MLGVWPVFWDSIYLGRHLLVRFACSLELHFWLRAACPYQGCGGAAHSLYQQFL
jgi:hypothetical protein